MESLSQWFRSVAGAGTEKDRTKRVLDKARERTELEEKESASKARRRGPIHRIFK